MYVVCKQTLTVISMYYGWDGDSGVIEMELIWSLHSQRLSEPHI